MQRMRGTLTSERMGMRSVAHKLAQRLAFAGVVLMWPVLTAFAQNATDVNDRAPRFYFKATPVPIALDITRTAVLRKSISVNFQRTKLSEALEYISRASGVKLMYGWQEVP